MVLNLEKKKRIESKDLLISNKTYFTHNDIDLTLKYSINREVIRRCIIF